jgi:hypothetical protein
MALICTVEGGGHQNSVTETKNLTNSCHCQGMDDATVQRSAAVEIDVDLTEDAHYL